MDITLKWLQLLHDPDDIVEIRSISPKPVISGYFKAGSDAIVREIEKYPKRTFYQTMNTIKSDCYFRTQNEHLVENPKATTADCDISGYRWILIDADPVRASGVSSSNEEKEAARKVLNGVKQKLKSLGFSDPILADSGNGYHLLYKIHASPAEKRLIADFLSVLDMWFSTDEVKIDTSVANPARITKLYGTVAQKGANTPNRPHRSSQIMRVPDELMDTSMELVDHVACQLQQMVTPPETSRTVGNAAFDLDRFLADHHVAVEKKVSISSGTKYLLAECPFDASHQHGEAAAFAFSNGSYGFRCFHNSCSQYHWHEFREKLDPQAYANSAYTIRKAVPIPPPEKVTNAANDAVQVLQRPRMVLLGDVPDLDRSKIVVIRSRFDSLDRKIGGFNKGELSIWSGGNGSGKSTLVSQLGLAAVSDGFKVAIFSGEMTAPRVKEWLLLQAAGPANVEEDKLNPNHFSVKAWAKPKITEWLASTIAIYDNDFGTDWESVSNTIFEWVRANHSDVVIIDNLMALDIPGTTMDKYDVQSKIVKQFSMMAKQLNVHIHFICHPRKTDAFLRKADISGTADITNAADNVFMVHRVNADFMTRYKSIYPKLVIPAEAGNVIEIMKNRDLGVVDELVMLYYDKTCKTMSDVNGLPIQHAWTEKLEQLSIDGIIPLAPEDVPDDFPEEWGRP